MLPAVSHVELFLATPRIGPPAQLVTSGTISGGESRTVGLVGAVSCAPGAGAGVVVVGMCLDPAQVAELAGLVAMIAGRSVLVLDTPELQDPSAFRAAVEPANSLRA